ncbi:uncharacterized protein [Diabrotica undecimpunctata]|uniref:uncharacterized protein n=1 Tax=Diabrotica undecimpunctata TaxID=50387 RepID=UPI003B6378A2
MAQSHMHGPVKLPPDFDIQGQNAATTWKFWKISFEDYLVATGKDQSADNIKLAIVRNILGTESARIMCTIAIPDGTAEPYKHMMEQLKVYVNPRANEVFERYKFLSRNQKEGEYFEHYLTEVKHLVKFCNFNVTDPDKTTEGKALRDRIVMDIRDTVTREALLGIDKLKLNKVIEICRASEISKNQNKMFAEESIAEIHAIKRFPKDKHTPHTSRKQQDKFKFACRVRNVENLDNQEKSDSDSDSSSSLVINNVNVSNQLRDLWNEIVEVKNSKFKVNLDTGADIRIDKQFKLCKNKFIVKGFEGTQAKTVGTVSLHCKYKNKNIYENFVIVEGANKILLGGQACVDLVLLKRINRVNIKKCNNNVEKDQFIAEHHKIFSGYGRFEGKFKITTTKNFKAVSYPPKKVPFAMKDALKNDLDRLVQRKAIVKVDEIDPHASINRIVIVEKRYHQLELDENSSWKCSFATSFGIYRYVVLPYGLSNSQDLFQEQVERNFGDLENVQILHDDMIVVGRDKEEHEKAVAQVIKRAKKTGAKFNKEKFQYCQRQVKFMGQVFSNKGKNIHFAHMLSRASLKVQENDPEMIEMVHSVSKHLPMSIEKRSILREFTKPQIQKTTYGLLCKQQGKVKIHYDKTARKAVTEFKKGDKVVVKSRRDEIWHKAVIIEKAKEPRSYWIRKEYNNRIVRRNTNQMKHSITKSQASELLLEPGFYPDLAQANNLYAQKHV